MTDVIWSIGSHCPNELVVVARLVAASTTGALSALGEFIARDLRRLASMVHIPESGLPNRWGCAIDAMHRLTEVDRHLRHLGVHTGTFLDLYDTLQRNHQWLHVSHLAHRDHSTFGPRGEEPEFLDIGDVVVVDFGDLYDRLLLVVHDAVDTDRYRCTELVSGFGCDLAHTDGWRVRFDQQLLT